MQLSLASVAAGIMSPVILVCLSRVQLRKFCPFELS